MSNQVDCEELMGKGSDDNLNIRNIKRLYKKKKKTELLEVIESNLEFLECCYFDPENRKSKRYNDIYKLVSSRPFIFAIKKLFKMAKKKKAKIPKGLYVILMDSIQRITEIYNSKMGEFHNGGKLNDTSREWIAQFNEVCKKKCNTLLDLIATLRKKETRVLLKEGINEPYASMISRVMVPAKYLDRNNVRRYLTRLNNTLIDIQKEGYVPNEDGTTYQNNVGIVISNRDVLRNIYSMFFHNVEREIVIQALLDLMLEFRPKALIDYKEPQRILYTEITNYLIEVLEGTDAIITKAPKGKKGKKRKSLKKVAKSEVITKKELKYIMKQYAKRCLNDARHGMVARRRIMFSALSPDDYPRLMNAYRSSNHNAVDEMVSTPQGDRDNNNNNRPQQQQNNNQQQRDNRDNRDNRDRDKNKQKREMPF